MISILRRVGLFQKIVERKLQKESLFYTNNRQFVLTSYRYLLKTIPTLYSRKLQQKQKLNELQYVFRNQKIHETLEQTKYKSQKLKLIVSAIKEKNYEYLGEYEIGLYNEANDITHELLNYRKKYGLEKRKY